MSKLKLILAITFVVLLIGSITSFATQGSPLSEVPPTIAQSINSVAFANGGLCPCGAPEHHEEPDNDNTVTVVRVPENTGDGNTNNDNTDTDDTGDDDISDENALGNNIDDDCTDCECTDGGCTDCDCTDNECTDCECADSGCTDCECSDDECTDCECSNCECTDDEYISDECPDCDCTDSGCTDYECADCECTDGECVDNGCTHENRCSSCDDCLDCGSTPCSDCCDYERRCGDCCCEFCNPVIITSLTLSIIINDKVYDSTTVATIQSYALIGIVDGHDVRLAETVTAMFDDKNVGNDKIVKFNDVTLVGKDSGYYTIPNSVSATASITPKPITYTISINDKTYNGSNNVELDTRNAVFDTVFADDDFYIDGYAEATTGSSIFVEENVPVTITGIVFGGADIDNYTAQTSIESEVNIVPKDISVNFTINNGIAHIFTTAAMHANVTGYAFNGTYNDDADLINLRAPVTAEFSIIDELTGSAEVGYNPIVFNNLVLEGGRAFNYNLLPVNNVDHTIASAVIGGQFAIVNKDSMFRIGSTLEAEPTNPTIPIELFADHTKQWYTLDSDNTETIVQSGVHISNWQYTTRWQDCDKTVHFRLIHRNNRNIMPAINNTDYVPYTINIEITQDIIPGLGAKMPGDDVNMQNPSDRSSKRTYSASHGRAAMIRYNLDNLTTGGIGLNSLYTDNIYIFDVVDINTAESDILAYFVTPADADQGVITIKASFVHRGLRITQTNPNWQLQCGYTTPSHTMLIENVGNAPTESFSLAFAGGNATSFNSSRISFDSLPVGGTTTTTITPSGTGSATSPTALGQRNFSTTARITGSRIHSREQVLTYSVSHPMQGWQGWRVDGALHSNRRGCAAPNSICSFVDITTHAPEAPEWGPWNHGTTTHCNRTRSTICAIEGCTLEHGRGTEENPEHQSYTLWSPEAGNYCQTQSLSQKRNCGVCDREFERSTGGTREHTHRAANCTQDNACLHCGHVTENAWGHAHRAANCIQDNACLHCGHVTENAWGHNPVSRGNYAATCQATGHTGRRVCDWGTARGNSCGAVTNPGTSTPRLTCNPEMRYEHSTYCIEFPKRTSGNMIVCRFRMTACTNGCGTGETPWQDLPFACASLPIQCFKCTIDEDNIVWFQDCDCLCFNAFCDEIEGCDFCKHEHEPMCIGCGWIKSLCECGIFGILFTFRE